MLVTGEIRSRIMAGAALLAIAILIAIGATVALGEIESQTTELSVVILAGVIELIVVLALVAILLDWFKLSNTSYAFALPPGSVRATIALLLILLFAILALFLFTQISAVADDESKVSVEGIRFANQVLTTLSTLVVAVAGFYFGTRSVAQAQGTDGGDAPPELREVLSGPVNAASNDPVQIELGGRHLLRVVKVTLRNAASEVSAAKVRSGDEVVVAEVPKSKVHTLGTPMLWDVIVTDDSGRESQLAAALDAPGT